MKATVEFTCQPMSYEGQELKEIYPDFAVDYPTTVGYRWQSCYAGPASWDLIIGISGVAALVGKGFLEELTKDLYKWTKARLLTVLHKRKNNVGYVAVKFEDLTISIDSSHPNDEILRFFEAIPILYSEVDSSLCSHWTIEADHHGILKVRPFPYSVGEKIEQNGLLADEISIQDAIAKWESRAQARKDGM
jgi:hypothetical protein